MGLAQFKKILNALDAIADDPDKFVREAVVGVITDDRVVEVLEHLFGRLMTTYVIPIVPASVISAVNEAMKNIRELGDLNEDGAVNVEDAGKAVHDTFDAMLPPFLKPFLPKWN